MYRRIVLPLDGSELAESVFPHVVELARVFDTEVVLLRAVTDESELVRESVTPHTPEIGMDLARRRREAEAESALRYLEGARARLAQLGLERVQVSVASGPPAAAILEAARSGPEQTIVAMATHGRGGLRRLAFGSVADRVVQELRGRPLLLFRPEER